MSHLVGLASLFDQMAKKLGVDGPGTARVEIVALDASKKVTKAPVRVIPLKKAESQAGNMFIQLGSFSQKENALKLTNELKAKKENAVVIKQVKVGKDAFFRIQIGPLLDLSEANSIQKRLNRKGYKRARIVIDDTT